MPSSEALTEPLLTALRRAGGHASSPQLQAALGVSQPTVSRALRPLLASGQVLKVGAARAQRYLLPRAIEGVGASIPITEIQPSGQARPFGHLIALAGGGFWMEEAHGRSAFHDSLPWFLYDMRPQGFLGRGFAAGPPQPAPARQPATLERRPHPQGPGQRRRRPARQPHRGRRAFDRYTGNAARATRAATPR